MLGLLRSNRPYVRKTEKEKKIVGSIVLVIILSLGSIPYLFMALDIEVGAKYNHRSTVCNMK